MRRATITLPDDLDAGVQAYQRSLDAPPTLTSLVHAALRAYLSERGYMARRGPFRLTAAEHGSGATDVSEQHDRELASG
jgi:hypothetical protein